MSNNVHFNKIMAHSSDSYFHSGLVLSIFNNGLVPPIDLDTSISYQ